MTIEEIQQEIIEEFEGFDDWMDRYQMLIDLGSEQEPLPVQYKTESNLIDGCQSRVWLQADLTPEGTVHFQAESDALIVKGIVTLLIRVLDNHTPDEILSADLHFIEDSRTEEGFPSPFAAGCTGRPHRAGSQWWRVRHRVYG